MVEPVFESWGVDESPVTIEYSRVVIEEVRQEVTSGMRMFSKGGMEVGGVLYGARDGRHVRIEAVRSIHCEHLRGPSFVLSDADRAGLEAQLREDAEDPRLNGLLCVGWYLSHTRGEIAMTEADLEIFATYFRDPWDVTLVIRPGRSGTMRAAFFVWEPDGTVRGSQSYKEFNFPDRLAGIVEPPQPRERGEARAGFRTLPPLPTPSAPASTPMPLTPPPPPAHSIAPMSIFESSQYYPSPAAEPKRWPWFVAALAILAILGFFGLRYFRPAEPEEPLGLAMVEREGQLEIHWNGTNLAIQRAARGTLTIQDGDANLKIPLTRGQLSEAQYSYARKGGDVEVVMEVEKSDGDVQKESSRFLGRPPAPPAPVGGDLQDLEAKKAALEAEVAKLKSENAGLNDRILQLERTRQILETRLGITQGK